MERHRAELQVADQLATECVTRLQQGDVPEELRMLLIRALQNQVIREDEIPQASFGRRLMAHARQMGTDVGGSPTAPPTSRDVARDTLLLLRVGQVTMSYRRLLWDVLHLQIAPQAPRPAMTSPPTVSAQPRATPPPLRPSVSREAPPPLLRPRAVEALPRKDTYASACGFENPITHQEYAQLNEGEKRWIEAGARAIAQQASLFWFTSMKAIGCEDGDDYTSLPLRGSREVVALLERTMNSYALEVRRLVEISEWWGDAHRVNHAHVFPYPGDSSQKVFVGTLFTAENTAQIDSRVIRSHPLFVFPAGSSIERLFSDPNALPLLPFVIQRAATLIDVSATPFVDGSYGADGLFRQSGSQNGIVCVDYTTSTVHTRLDANDPTTESHVRVGVAGLKEAVGPLARRVISTKDQVMLTDKVINPAWKHKRPYPRIRFPVAV